MTRSLATSLVCANKENQELCDGLLKVVEEKLAKGEEKRAAAVSKAMKSVSLYPLRLERADDATKLAGVGNYILGIIRRIMNDTGKEVDFVSPRLKRSRVRKANWLWVIIIL